MKPITLISRLVGGWLLVEAALYWLFVPQYLATTNFLFISAVLLLLVIVGIAKWRDSGFEQSIASTLYDVEHRTGRKS